MPCRACNQPAKATGRPVHGPPRGLRAREERGPAEGGRDQSCSTPMSLKKPERRKSLLKTNAAMRKVATITTTVES